jgi:hypothetical protein
VDAQDADSDGSIGRYEFTIYFLKLWGMADEGVIKAVNERFKVCRANTASAIEHHCQPNLL